MRPVDVPPVLAAEADHDTQVILLLRAELQEVLAVAAPLGMTPVILKGGAALHDPTRAVAAKDLDFLLPGDQAPRLVAALDAAGWRSEGGATGLHFAGRVREGRPPIEIHTTAAPGVARLDAHAWERSVPHPAIPSLRLLAPADQIHHLAVHQAIQHSSHRGRLRDLFLLADELHGQPPLAIGGFAVDQVMEMATTLASDRTPTDHFPQIAAIWYALDADAGAERRGTWHYPFFGWVFEFAIGGASMAERWERMWEARLEAKSWLTPLRPLETRAPWLLRPLRILLRFLWLPPMLAVAWALAKRELAHATRALAAIDHRP